MCLVRPGLGKSLTVSDWLIAMSDFVRLVESLIVHFVVLCVCVCVCVWGGGGGGLFWV